MKFLLRFVGFGLLFFAIHKLMPEAFDTLVSWVGQLYDLLEALIQSVREQLQSSGAGSGNGASQ